MQQIPHIYQHKMVLWQHSQILHFIQS